MVLFELVDTVEVSNLLLVAIPTLYFAKHGKTFESFT